MIGAKGLRLRELFKVLLTHFKCIRYLGSNISVLCILSNNIVGKCSFFHWKIDNGELDDDVFAWINCTNLCQYLFFTELWEWGMKSDILYWLWKLSNFVMQVRLTKELYGNQIGDLYHSLPFHMIEFVLEDFQWYVLLDFLCVQIHGENLFLFLNF